MTGHPLAKDCCLRLVLNGTLTKGKLLKEMASRKIEVETYYRTTWSSKTTWNASYYVLNLSVIYDYMELFKALGLEANNFKKNS